MYTFNRFSLTGVKGLQQTKPGTERVQALADISHSALCYQNNKTRAPIANPPIAITSQQMVVSTLKLVETFIASGETCDALSRSVGQLDRK